MTRTRTRRRVGAREARRAQRNKRAAGSVSASLRGGTYKPLSDQDIERVHQTALDVLEKVGMGNPPPILRERALARGCWVDDHDRLCFPRTLVEDVIAAMPREIVMHGLDPDYDMESSAGRVIFAPGGDVSEVAGMMASLMGCSFEAMVIDNDMLGNIARVLRGIEVTEETLSFETIRDVVRGPGHYLGHSQTLSLMESEYIYPGISDRRSYGEWEETGRLDIVDAAQARVREILSTHYPGHIDPATNRKIREQFDILLPEDAMRPGNGRW